MARRIHLSRACASLMLAACLAGCGFHLRGSNGQFNLPFHSIYVAFPETSPLGAELKRNLRANGETIIASAPEGAEAQFDVLAEARGESILSLNSQGRVREYQLSYSLTFRVRDAKGKEILGPTEISLKRAFPFNETQVLAKEAQEVQLYRDMQSDLVQQILRRLAAIKPA
ncbi:MAG: LPS assembly lipoprotein LptE [Pseudomonadota bacterium]